MTTRSLATTKKTERGGLPRHRLSALVLLGLTGVSLYLSACGVVPASQVAQLGSAATTTQGGSGPNSASKYGEALYYSRCMRSHGVLNFPDPKEVGGAIQISGSGHGMNANSPTYRSAQQSCRHLAPGGGEPTSSERQQALAQTLQLSTCMRAHGVTGFPDPTLSPPSSRVGYGAIMSRDGVWLAVPNSIDEQSTAFVDAAAACHYGGTS